MEYAARDLGRVELWEDSLLRSLERRGRTRRASVELHRLRSARDLTIADVLERSARYSELRRQAATHRSSMPRPNLALGSLTAAIAAVGGVTLSSVLSSGGTAHKAQVANAADLHASLRREAAVRGNWSGASEPAVPVTHPPAQTTTSAQTAANVNTRGHAAKDAAQRATAVSHTALAASTTTSDGGTGLTGASVKRARTRAHTASHTTTAGMPPLIAGVYELQRQLHVNADGSFGPITERAVKHFQRAHDLKVTGVVNRATRRVLGLGSGPVLRPNPALVKHRVTHRAAPPVQHAAAPTSAADHTGGAALPRTRSVHVVTTVHHHHHASTPAQGTATGPTATPAPQRAARPAPTRAARPAPKPHPKPRPKPAPTRAASPAPKPAPKPAPTPAPSAGYINPLRYVTDWERTDMGVDASMSPGAPILAPGTVKILGIIQNWYAGEPFIYFQLLSGPDAGKVQYVAEQITDLAQPGTVLQQGQVIARFAGSGTGIEYGWGTASGETLAEATTGYHEGEITAAGASMRAWLNSLGAGAGPNHS